MGVGHSISINSRDCGQESESILPGDLHRGIPIQQYTNIGDLRAPNPSPMTSGMVGLRDFGPSTSTGSQIEPMQLPIDKATHFAI
eukprot:scaffold13490_cov69-Attheya_sp.AAC.1